MLLLHGATTRRGAPVLSDVSVVIICWNQGRFLADAIDSVLPQLASEAQLIVVDNGSTDETAKVAASYPGARYRFQGNAGPSGARNAGLADVVTPFVLFLDADDMLLPGALEAARTALSQSPNEPLAYGGFCEVDADGGLLFEAPVDWRGRTFDGLLTGNHIAMHGTVLYRTEAVRAAGGFDASLMSCEDYDLYLRLAKTGPFAAYELIAAKYRRHGDNATRDAAMMLRNAMTVMARHRPARGAPAELRSAYRAGLQFWRDYYGERLVGQLRQDFGRGRIKRFVHNFAVGVTSDPAFPARILGRAAGRLLHRWRAASSSPERDVTASARGDRARDRQG
jgi:glycosyltransferase involved in cell wall biosynthesis